MVLDSSPDWYNALQEIILLSDDSRLFGIYSTKEEGLIICEIDSDTLERTGKWVINNPGKRSSYGCIFIIGDRVYATKSYHQKYNQEIKCLINLKTG